MEIRITNASLTGFSVSGTNILLTVAGHDGNATVSVDDRQVTGSVNGQPAHTAVAGSWTDNNGPTPGIYSESIPFIPGGIMPIAYPQGGEKKVLISPVTASDTPVAYEITGAARGRKDGTVVINVFADGDRDCGVDACLATAPWVFDGPNLVQPTVSGNTAYLAAAVGSPQPDMPYYDLTNGLPLYVNVRYRSAWSNQGLEIAAHDR